MATQPAKKEDIQPIYRQFGSKIAALRTTLGLTQDELAKRVGLKRTSIVNIEAGRQRVLLDDVEKFAAAFATTPKFLLRGIWI
jgi:transcriptional regulator with XRE-family HTH domain